jgi:hypothetical protein
VLAKLRSYRPGHATVVAYLALFVALGGSSYAAITITGKNVKDRSLTAKDIKKNSLTTTEVRDRSMLSKDFKPGQLPAGPQGIQGLQGLQGPQGTAGSARAYGHVAADANATLSNSKNIASVTIALGFTSLYCINTTVGAVQNITATIGPAGDTAAMARAGIGTGATCPAGTDATVITSHLVQGATDLSEADSKEPFNFALN